MTDAEGGHDPGRGRRQSTDRETLRRLFATTDSTLPLWIAEPTVPLAPSVSTALQARAASGWYGYETRPHSVLDGFWHWMLNRHHWDGSQLRTCVSPSVGTSIGVLLQQLTEPGDGVIIQPPVFTDFKTLISSNNRTVVRNPLLLTDEGYRFDLDDLALKTSEPANRLLILCSPHNPVGRVWTRQELSAVASICAEHDVFVVADEIHADLALPPHQFVPVAEAAAHTNIGWAATHGPIKTFGLAGVCDTLLITNRDDIADRFQSTSSQLHLTRNNVFGLAAFDAAYRQSTTWFDEFLQLIVQNTELLKQRLPNNIHLIPLEGTYLAWLDLRELGLAVSDIPNWLASAAGLALSPGHWFGREGAGFARMTIATPTNTIKQAAAQLTTAAKHR